MARGLPPTISASLAFLDLPFPGEQEFSRETSPHSWQDSLLNYRHLVPQSSLLQEMRSSELRRVTVPGDPLQGPRLDATFCTGEVGLGSAPTQWGGRSLQQDGAALQVASGW